MSKEHFNPDGYYIAKVSRTVAKPIIVRYHYAHVWTASKVCLGLYSPENKLVGVSVYGTPGGRKAADSISPRVKNGEVLELKRLWIEDEQGTNAESWFIAQTITWLKKNMLEIKALISYSDPSEDHNGIVYQATNWLYVGYIRSGVEFTIESKGELIHTRTWGVRYGSCSREAILERDPNAKFHFTHPKYRYIYILASGSEKKKILRTLKHKPLPYPKDKIEEFDDRQIKLDRINPNKKAEKFFS